MDEDQTGALTVARVSVMILLPLVTFILGILPLQLARWLKWDKEAIAGLQGNRAQFILSKLLCFAGGVLLATVFLHLLPDLEIDCAEQVKKGNLPDLGEHLPWAELLLCIGFFFVFLVEELAHAFVHWQSKTKHPSPDKPFAPSPCIEELQQNVTGLPNNKSEKDDLEELTVGNGHGHSHEGGHSHVPVVSGDSLLASIRGALTVMALSLHCIFEGLAVGIQRNPADVWTLFGAIASHKFVIAFCVGVELLASGTKRILIYVYTFIFGIVSAIGIGAGMAVAGSGGGEESDDKNGVTVTLQGMAAGTIVYVIFFEILQREKTHKDNGFYQLLSIILGFLAMIGLMSLAPEH